MTTAVVARQSGDDYQARIFWLEACRLFSDHSKVRRVAFEYDRIRSFDDVAVFYDTAVPDERGGRVTADFYQAKFHVDFSGSLTCEGLIDPEAIHASTVSFLERLHAAATHPDGADARFNFVSAWGIHPDDALAELVSARNGEIRLEKLFDGTTDRSAKGKIRRAWREKLGLTTDDALKKVLTGLRIHAPYRKLEDLRKDLNIRLELAGLKPVDEGCVGHPYDDLIRKLHGSGANEFDRKFLRSCCEAEGLWLGRAEASDRTPIGIRSFLRFAEHLEDETAHLLCLLRHFDDRAIREFQSWQNDIGPEVATFLSQRTGRTGKYLLHLDAHSSIALLAGYVLDMKSGVDIALMQRGAGKSVIWEFNPAPASASLAVAESVESASEGGAEVAVAISVSNEIGSEVREYVNKNLPAVGKLVLISIMPRPGQSAVRDAAHAFEVAEGAAAIVRANRAAGGETLHLFWSAPNVVTFFFGRMARGLGRIQAYEYLFESGKPSAYVPSISMPWV